MVFITRLKGDLTEHHPYVGKVKAAAEGFCPAAVKRHGHIAGTWVFVIQHRLEYHRLWLPVGNEVGLKPTGDGRKDLHATDEHVVTVNLEEQMGLSVCCNNFELTHWRMEIWSAEVKPNRCPHLHGGEVTLPVKSKFHFHVSLSAQRVVLPAQIVVARPHVVLTSHQKVVQADHAVRQLAHPPRQLPA